MYMYAKEDLFGRAGLSVMLNQYFGKTPVDTIRFAEALRAIRAEHAAFEAGRIGGRAQAEACIATQEKLSESLA